MVSADPLSCLPLPAIESSSGEIDLLINQLSEARVTAFQIKVWTEKDPLLSLVHHQVLHGWTVTNPNANLQPYFNYCDELSVTDGYVLWGSRAIVPPPGHDIILKQLHDTHQGIESLARSYCMVARNRCLNSYYLFMDAQYVRTIDLLLKLPYICGNSLLNLGPECILIMLDLILVKCS